MVLQILHGLSFGLNFLILWGWGWFPHRQFFRFFDLEAFVGVGACVQILSVQKTGRFHALIRSVLGRFLQGSA